MLRVHWRSSLTGEERAAVENLVDGAAAHDDEAGFSRVPTDEFEGAAGRHLVVRLLPRSSGQSEGLAQEYADEELPVVAYLRVEVRGDRGEIGYVVHPDHRSLGISTMLFEQLGFDVHGTSGWQGTGARSLTVWAHGAHPATERMSRRFGARPVRRLWRLARPFHGELATPLPPRHPADGLAVRPMTVDDVPVVSRVLEEAALPDRIIGRRTLTDVRGVAGSRLDPEQVLVAERADGIEGILGVSPDPALVDGHRRTVAVTLLAGRATTDPEIAERLFVEALHLLDGRGAWAAAAYVDSEEVDVAKAALSASYEHEQSDVCYEIH